MCTKTGHDFGLFKYDNLCGWGLLDCESDQLDQVNRALALIKKLNKVNIRRNESPKCKK